VNNLAAVYEDSIMKCIESCLITGEQDDRERESNRRG
jgi:hypothetical protein